MSAIQSNVTQGRLAFTADADLTGKEMYLVKLTRGADGKAEVTLPTDVADWCPFVIVDVPEASYTAGYKVYVLPLSSDQNVRCIAAGAITAGDSVVLSETFGKVQTQPIAADTYFRVGYAEEDATAGQYVLIRPAPATVVVT